MTDEKQLKAYRAAGELFGHLEAALGFGELTMHKEARVFVFSWSFNTKGKPYGSQLFVDNADIVFGCDVPDLASRTAKRWKSDRKKLSDEQR